MTVTSKAKPNDSTSGWQGQTAEVAGNVRYQTKTTYTYKNGASKALTNLSGPQTVTMGYTSSSTQINRQRYTPHYDIGVNLRPGAVGVYHDVWNDDHPFPAGVHTYTFRSTGHPIRMLKATSTGSWNDSTPEEQLPWNTAVVLYQGSPTYEFTVTGNFQGMIGFYTDCFEGDSSDALTEYGEYIVEITSVGDPFRLSITMNDPYYYSWDSV